MFNKEALRKGSRVFRGRQEFVKSKSRKIAVKLIEYREKNLREISILSKLSHPNIVQIFEAGEYQALGHWIYIAMELCSQNLQNYFDDNKTKPVDKKKANSFFRQLVDGVSFIHENNITHRDLKPYNILISICKNFIKLADFGLSKEIPDGKSVASATSSGIGSDGYRAPEMYCDNPQTSPRSDIFSLGIITFAIFTNGKHPFGSDPFDWSYNIRKDIKGDMSQISCFREDSKRRNLQDLINQMLQREPADRPKASQIRDHSIFTGRKSVSP